MMVRRGFTLVEVMIALLIGSVVVVLAYATLSAGLDTQDRVNAARDADASATALRAILTDAVRHAVSGDAVYPRGMYTGEAGTSLNFATRGVEAPLGGTALWQLSLTADTGGVALRAVSRDGNRAPLLVTARGSRRFAVRFLPLASSEWRATWDDPTRLPEAVELRFLDAQGHDAMPPLLARTAPVSGA